MSTKICILASGSKGNCTYVTDGMTRILIDVGISCRKIEEGLSAEGIGIADLDAILITHEHIDHVYGLHTLAKKYDVPIFANQRTAVSVDVKMRTDIARKQKDNFDTGFRVGTVDVFPFRVSHDASCPVGYVLTLGGHKVAYCTDLGTVTDSVRNNVVGCDAVILESNHDVKMLQTGPYPPDLQARIRSELGHLSNDQCCDFAVELAREGTRHLVLAHLSEQNNTPSLATKAVQDALKRAGATVALSVAKQNSAIVVEL